MHNEEQPNVGHEIRSIREKKGFSLRTLSNLAGLSANAISKIERGENSPTVSSLHNLASALGVSVTEFFISTENQTVVKIDRKNTVQIQEDGLVIEGLGGGLPHQQFEPFLMTVDPGRSNITNPAIHSGEEFIRCLEGIIEYKIGHQEFRLQPGDNLHFKASEKHSWYNPGKTPAKFLVIFQTDHSQLVPHRISLETKKIK